MSPTEAEITADLVRVLLEEQHPDLADLPVRLGAVRLPWATRSADELLFTARAGRAATAHGDEAGLRIRTAGDKNRPTAEGELPTSTLTRAGTPGWADQVRVMCSQVERISV
ncbi:hypothetical protein [Streptomyces parvulus]|uniref:hypothetical protein n=1 Tax=Streptomyces parvulus TaxID=146923 RepID=UPI003F4D763E